MLRNKIYYTVKPFLPWRVRMAMRRWFSEARRRRSANAWPIMPGSERPPAGWTGWPDGKKFALILTHDVERQPGLDKCRGLMELERELGFRSCFNFVPEGDYRLSYQFREELTDSGFEVGVHDLHHDGKLYHSRRAFTQKAGLINHYLREWKAVGFRSGFMLHNLEWLHDLGIQYDSSTFDTDPFEPQPDGVGTIFPFWVPRPNGVQGSGFRVQGSGNGNGNGNGQESSSGNGNGHGNGNGGSSGHSQLSTPHSQLTGTPRSEGYVELPYTLPQDSTLFLLFRQRTPDVWFEKLDWVARHGGTATIATHPDYMGMNGCLSGSEYPVAFYRDLLEYARRRYGDSFWQPLPSELADWYRREALRPAEDDLEPPRRTRRHPGALRGKRAAVVVYSGYPWDARPRRELGALLDEGMTVDLICLDERGNEPRRETHGRLHITRLPLTRVRRGKSRYFIQYGRFWLSCFRLLSARSLVRRYDLVHVHNMPDVLVFSALVPRLLGARIILDLHDPMPELMMTIFGVAEDHFLVRFLKLAEKASARFAHQVLTVNLCCKRIFSARSCAADKVQVIMNSPDPRIFRFRPFEESGSDSARPFVLMYHGSIVERSGLDLAIEAAEMVREKFPQVELRVYGARTPFFNRVMEKSGNGAARNLIRYMGSRTLEEIAQEITRCDVGIIPNRRNTFTELNTPIRILEYLSRGKPVIAPRARGITDYFGQDGLLFFELGDPKDLARQIERAFRNRSEMQQVVERGQKVYLAHSWTRQRENFLDTVTKLVVPSAMAARPVETAEACEESRVAVTAPLWD